MGATALTSKISATPSRFDGLPVPSPPSPGFKLFLKLGSEVPRGNIDGINGRPMSRPWPGIMLQFVPWINPMEAQVWSITLVSRVAASPAYAPYRAARLLAGADFSSAGVSYHPVPDDVEEFEILSYAKKKNSLFFHIGPPMLPPQSLKREVFLCGVSVVPTGPCQS